MLLSSAALARARARAASFFHSCPRLATGLRSKPRRAHWESRPNNLTLYGPQCVATGLRVDLERGMRTASRRSRPADSDYLLGVRAPANEGRPLTAESSAWQYYAAARISGSAAKTLLRGK